MRSRVRTRLKAFRIEHFVCVIVVLMLAGAAVAQEKSTQPRLSSLAPTGKSFMTKTYGTLGFNLSNSGDGDLSARVLTFYDGAPAKQYGRDLWVPPHTSLWSWFTIAPPDEVRNKSSVEIKSLLLDRSAGAQHLQRSDL